MSVVEVQIDAATGVATLAMNRPERFNALSLDLLDGMLDALAGLARDPACRALIVTGKGTAFCAGADLGAFDALRREGRHLDSGEQVAETMEQRFNPLVNALYTFPKPVVSAVNGIAAGGGAGIALCADIVLCASAGTFKFVQAQQLGIVADMGAHWLLQRLGGRATALGATLLGETLDAPRAAALGLVWEVVPDDALLTRARLVAEKLALVPRDVVIGTRALVDASATAAFAAVLDSERLYQRDFCARPGFLARIEAFLARSRGKNRPER